jgi:hypothetical protein
VADHDESLAQVVEALKESVRLDPNLTSRVMAAIERLPASEPAPPGGGPILGWTKRRWTIRLSPLGGLAVAAGLAGVAVAAGRLIAPPRSGPETTGPSLPGAGRGTQFVLVAPRAASVAVVGDFNDWNLSATPLVRAEGDGLWWVTIPLPPGRYRYSFVVDGDTWLPDPEAPAAEDEFGRPNSVVTIGGP